MKFGIPFLIALVAVFFMACGGEEKTEDASTDTMSTPDNSIQQNTDPAGVNAGGNLSNVFHYTCPNNCEGSGGASAGTCPVCGSEYEHNAAFHSQNSGATPNQPIELGDIQSQEAPTQNASGAFHYACTKEGCDGGGSQAGNCPKCGSALAHNPGFHQ